MHYTRFLWFHWKTNIQKMKQQTFSPITQTIMFSSTRFPYSSPMKSIYYVNQNRKKEMNEKCRTYTSFLANEYMYECQSWIFPRISTKPTGTNKQVKPKQKTLKNSNNNRKHYTITTNTYSDSHSLLAAITYHI